MKVVGIVSEYNPLHTGHAFHIRASVEKPGATHVILRSERNFVLGQLQYLKWDIKGFRRFPCFLG